MRHFRAGAEKGDPDSMLLYVTGEKDKGAVEEWLKKAAEKGDPNAMMLYALFLEKDHGTGKDEAATEKWLKKAMDAGNPTAQALYGSYLVGGEQEAEGLENIKRSADSGNILGMHA